MIIGRCKQYSGYLRLYFTIVWTCLFIGVATHVIDACAIVWLPERMAYMCVCEPCCDICLYFELSWPIPCMLGWYARVSQRLKSTETMDFRFHCIAVMHQFVGSSELQPFRGNYEYYCITKVALCRFAWPVVPTPRNPLVTTKYSVNMHWT